MAAYLIDHPPRTQQFRCPRRRTPSGIIGVHTAETFADEVGPDSSAENVAAFIQRRSNYGSYHLLADSDSIIQLIPFECVAYHIGTHSLNEHTIGVSAAVQAAKWDDYDDDHTDAVVRNMARAAAQAARWLKAEHGIAVPARRITLAQALDGQAGFLAHGDADPARRTDPGETFPWTTFLAYYAAEMGGTTEEDDMTPEQEAKLDQAITAIGLARQEIVDEARHQGPKNAIAGVRALLNEVGGTYLSRQSQAVANLVVEMHNRTRAAVQAAVATIPGVDVDDLAAKLAVAMPEQSAEDIMDALAARLAE